MKHLHKSRFFPTAMFTVAVIAFAVAGYFILPRTTTIQAPQGLESWWNPTSWHADESAATATVVANLAATQALGIMLGGLGAVFALFGVTSLVTSWRLDAGLRPATVAANRVKNPVQAAPPAYTAEQIDLIRNTAPNKRGEVMSTLAAEAARVDYEVHPLKERLEARRAEAVEAAGRAGIVIPA